MEGSQKTIHLLTKSNRGSKKERAGLVGSLIQTDVTGEKSAPKSPGTRVFASPSVAKHQPTNPYRSAYSGYLRTASIIREREM